MILGAAVSVPGMSEPGDLLSIVPTASGFAVAGEIDAHTAPLIAEALAGSDQDPLVVDLSGVEFVDSSGLRVLLEAHQARTAAGTSLVLSEPSAAVRRVFDIAGVNAYLDVASSD